MSRGEESPSFWSGSEHRPAAVRPDEEAAGSSRRGFFAVASGLLAGGAGLVLAIPGVGYLLSPLLKPRSGEAGYIPVARLGDLEEGVPRSFPVIESRQDAWVRYPAEPIGTVWLVRQKAGSAPAVIALSAECPHLACAVNLSPDGSEFFCPCHTSSFSLAGDRKNQVSPRGMDALEVEPFDANDPEALIRVKYQRFRTMTEEKIPLA